MLAFLSVGVPFVDGVGGRIVFVDVGVIGEDSDEDDMLRFEFELATNCGCCMTGDDWNEFEPVVRDEDDDDTGNASVLLLVVIIILQLLWGFVS